MTAPLPADARVLVIDVARIGDTLLATPVLQALRAALPEARITCWAHPKRMEALAHLDCIDRLEGITKTGAPLRGRLTALTGKPYAAACVLGHEPALRAAAARLSKRVAAFVRRGERTPSGVTDPVPQPEGIHAVDDRLSILAPFGIAAASRRLAWRVTDNEAAGARAWLDAQLPGWRDGPLLGLQIASFPTKAYRDWPAGHFAELLRRFFAAHPDGRAVLFGDAAGRAQAIEVAQVADQFGAARAAVLAGEATLRASAAVMAQCSAYAGVDTGPSHIAGALGLPMVVMYHPLHPGYNLMPLEHPAPLAVVEHPALAPGMAHAAAKSAQMADIPVDAIWQAVQKVLPR